MTRVNVRFRPAARADVPALADLVHCVDPGPAGRSLDDVGPVGERLARAIDAGRTVVVAVDEAGTVVGLLIARPDEVGAVDLTPVMHVTHLVVAPGHRRRGIARGLLTAAVQAADENGVEHVLATVAAGSREGNRYLARLGFAPLVVNRLASTAALHRSLGITEASGRVAVLRRARVLRARGGQRPGIARGA